MKADSFMITWLLQESGITPHTIAKQLGINKQTIYNLANGDSKMENITFGTAAALTDLAEKKMKEDGIMKIWSRNGYTVEEREFDYNLHKFVIVVDGEDAAEIVPDTVEDMQDVISQLDTGEEAVGMADGQGGEVYLPQYIVDVEDPRKVALSDFGITQHINTYSRKEAEKLYNGIFDKGLTVLLSKLEHGEIELIEERIEE